jgi:hypothetical protein
MIERLVVEVPRAAGRTLSDLKVGGVPVRYGGQIAECITVKLVGGAALVNVTGNDLLDASLRGLVVDRAPTEIYDFGDAGKEAPPGLAPAFSQYDAGGAPEVARKAKPAGRPVAELAVKGTGAGRRRRTRRPL